MRTESSGRRVMTASEIAARVIELAPEFLQGMAPERSRKLSAGSDAAAYSSTVDHRNRGTSCGQIVFDTRGSRPYVYDNAKGGESASSPNSSGRSLRRKSVVGQADGIPGEHRDGDGQHCIGVEP